MSELADKIKQYLNGFFNDSINENKDFFSKSTALNLLKAASLVSISALLQSAQSKIREGIANNKSTDKGLLNFENSKNVTDEEIEAYVKSNRNLQRIMKQADKNLSDEAVSDIILACEDPDYYEDKAEAMQRNLAKVKGNLSQNDFLRIANSQSNFDERVNNVNLNRIEDVISSIKDFLPYAFLSYVFILKVREFLTQNEFPSTFRAKYLQKQMRYTGAILKRQIQSYGPEYANKFNDILDTLKSLDTLIAASIMATFIYLNNRKIFQRASSDTLQQINSSFACGETQRALTDEETSVEPSEINLDASTLLDNFSCPIEIEEPVVPHEPFEDKLSNERLAACEVIQNEPTPDQLSSEFTPDTANKAIIANTSEKKFSIDVKPSQRVTTRTLIGAIGGSNLYSPVEGVVYKVEDNKIYIEDIEDENNSYLEELLTKIQDLYKEFNDTKFFLKDFYIDSLYPVMLKYSPLIDEEISDEEQENIEYYDGMEKRFLELRQNYKNILNIYETTIQEVTGKDNVKEKSENEKLNELKDQIDNVENKFYKTLASLGVQGVNQAQVTLPKEGEFVLIEYYFLLYRKILELWEQTEVSKPFRNKINSILIDRYFIDGWNPIKLKQRLNSMCESLAEGTFFEDTPNFFNEMIIKYNENKRLKDVKDYVNSLAQNNDDFTDLEKQNIIDKVMFIFEFALDVLEKVREDYNPDLNKFEATEIEANFIENYLRILWKRYREIPKELDEIYLKLDELGNTLITYTIKEIDNEQYRYYALGESRKCPLEEDNEGYSSPFSEYEFKDIEYWFKYCSFATLASVTNPIQGWSTGIPPPIGPITLPVVYIPIKAFQLNWGFILIGLTVTGIYPFPMVLFSNLDMLYHVPIGDPTTIIKREIQGLKKTLTNQISDFRNDTLRNFLSDKKNKIDQKNEKIEDLEEEKRLIRLDKPKRKRVDDEGNPIDDSENYSKELLKWNSEKAATQLKLSSAKTERFILEQEYQIVYRIYSGEKLEGEPVDPKIISIQKTEQAIEKQFDALDKAINSIENIIKPLPITTKPASANFGITIKNPKPIINFAEDLDDNTNTEALKPILERFKIRQEDFMNSNFVSKIPGSFTNWDSYKTALKGATPILIKGDPFPKYENLKFSNVPWILFLYMEWVPIGAQTYGFPIFSPLPSG